MSLCHRGREMGLLISYCTHWSNVRMSWFCTCLWIRAKSWCLILCSQLCANCPSVPVLLCTTHAMCRLLWLSDKDKVFIRQVLRDGLCIQHGLKKYFILTDGRECEYTTKKYFSDAHCLPQQIYFPGSANMFCWQQRWMCKQTHHAFYFSTAVSESNRDKFMHNTMTVTGKGR